MDQFSADRKKPPTGLPPAYNEAVTPFPQTPTAAPAAAPVYQLFQVAPNYPGAFYHPNLGYVMAIPVSMLNPAFPQVPGAAPPGIGNNGIPYPNIAAAQQIPPAYQPQPAPIPCMFPQIPPTNPTHPPRPPPPSYDQVQMYMGGLLPQAFPQPDQPLQQPAQPFQQPAQPFQQPGQPFQQPAQPFQQPGQPFQQPAQPFQQPTQPFQQPTQPFQNNQPPISAAPAQTAQSPQVPQLKGKRMTAFNINYNPPTQEELEALKVHEPKVINRPLYPPPKYSEVISKNAPSQANIAPTEFTPPPASIYQSHNFKYESIRVNKLKDLLPSWVSRADCDRLLELNHGNDDSAINYFFDHPELFNNQPQKNRRHQFAHGPPRNSQPPQLIKQADIKESEGAAQPQPQAVQEPQATHAPDINAGQMKSPPLSPQEKRQQVKKPLPVPPPVPPAVLKERPPPEILKPTEADKAPSVPKEAVQPKEALQPIPTQSLNVPEPAASSAPEPLKSPRTSQPSGTPISPRVRPTMPEDLQEDIHQFQWEDYAKTYFMEHRKGFFRRKIPVKEILSFQQEPLQQPLLKLDAKLIKEALSIFSLVQLYMGDREPGEREGTDPTRLVQKIVSKGLTYPSLRDETYCQICKQIKQNPKQTSALKGWELLVITIESYQPSRGLEPYLKKFIYDSMLETRGEEKSKVPKFAEHSLRRLAVYARSKFEPRLPTPQEIKQAKIAPFAHSLFGGNLEEMMKDQQVCDNEIADLRVPRVIVALTDCIEASGGFHTEGIFRISAKREKIIEMRTLIENGIYDLPKDDAHVPACLLKQWMAEIVEPVIPSNFYELLIVQHDNISGILSIIKCFPREHEETLYYLVRFMQRIAAFQSETKMGLSNLALVLSPNMFRCPLDNPLQALENTKFETDILLLLAKELNLDRFSSRNRT